MERVTDPLLDNLYKKFRTEMNEMADVAATGGCEDYAKYQYVCGVINGLARAERFLLDLDEMQRSNEDIE